jgi:hypothetical protein
VELFLWFTLLLSTQQSPSTNLTWNFFFYIAIVETPSAWRIADRRYVSDMNDYLDYIWWNLHTEGRPIADRRYVSDMNDYLDYIWWNLHTEGRSIAEHTVAQNRL